MRKFLALSLVAVLTGFAGVASAQVTALNVTSSTSLTPPGYVVNDLFIDFDGQLFGNQILTGGLQVGDIYQDAAGNDFGPNSVVAGIIPTLANDTFLQFGDPFNDNAGSITPGVAGEANGLGSVAAGPTFDNQLLDIAYFEPGGAPDVLNESGYFVGRITLLATANGTFDFLGNAGQTNNNQIYNLSIVNGAIVPEPATVALLGLGGILTLVRRRHA